MKEDYFSAKSEPAHSEGRFEADPTERKVGDLDARQDEIAEVRDSVLNEPAMGAGTEQPYLGEWINRKRAECTIGGNLGAAFLAALLGGPFAIVGAFMSSTHGWYGPIYIVVLGPVVEEFLKQSGMIYLLEKKPYRVFAAWQFVFSAVVSALFFATIENLIYIYVYVDVSALSRPELFVRFRWTVCTALHVFCSGIASLGLIRVWRRQLADGRAADLSAAYRYFAAAIVIHGLYNLGAVLLGAGYFKAR
ncbi:MAG: PrsW family intramembrane metalloprotease [Sedimentisphaerales bacterium]|nr:PrsW family intramembrane metalloprotease [Sedimentisphaerales bacterium]